MAELLPFLKTLLSAPGLSGHEIPVRQLIHSEWAPLVDEIQVSRLGSLHAFRHGASVPPRPSLLLAAHMDAIGLMVTAVVDGFLRMTSVGGIDSRILPGQPVTVHTQTKDLPGQIVQPAAALLPVPQREGSIPLEYLWVDVGLRPAEVQRLVRVGDLISFAQAPFELNGDILVGHSLDNRASVAAVTHCLQLLQGRRLDWDVWAVATVQEEETLAGAATSAFELRPSLAVAIDVTFASGPGSPAHGVFPLGKGVTLGWGPNIHPGLYRRFKALAERLEIPWLIEPMPRHSGTDAVSLQVAAEGIPTMVLGIPLRYMHTPVEMVAMKDIQRAGRLLAEFAAGLDLEFMKHLTWDEE